MYLKKDKNMVIYILFTIYFSFCLQCSELLLLLRSFFRLFFVKWADDVFVPTADVHYFWVRIIFWCTFLCKIIYRFLMSSSEHVGSLKLIIELGMFIFTLVVLVIVSPTKFLYLINPSCVIF